jgi:type VI secretion system protein ImpJ
MARYHKVLWSEGLFLTQHHFQQFDAFHEQDRSFLVRTLLPFAWGASHLVIDTEAVTNRMLNLTEFEGVMPDGTTVRAPAVDDPPPPRSFDDLFAPTEKVLSVYLALPRIRPGVPGVKMDGGGDHDAPTRYHRAFATVADDVTGENEREIPYLKKRLTVLFSGEGLEGYDYMKVAEIDRNAEGVTQLRPTFIPPLLAVSASPWLTAQLRGVLEAASARSLALSTDVRQRTDRTTEVSTSDLPNYLRLHTVNAYIPSLMHMHSYPHLHPLELFQRLAQFAGHLCVFRTNEYPRDLPGYKHDDLEHCFVPMVEKLRDLLEFREIHRYTRIPVRKIEDAHFESEAIETSLFDAAIFYLGISAEISESRLASEFPRHAKVVSPRVLPRLIGSAIPGANLIYEQLPPAALPRKAGMVYFRIDSRGDRWDFIKREAQLAIYAPPKDFPSLDVECVAVHR